MQLMKMHVRSMLNAAVQCIARNANRRLFVLNCIALLANVFYALNNHMLLVPFWNPIEWYFLSPLDPGQNVLLDRTFRAFAEAMDSENVTFFIFSGSLVGSVRHHGRIPWDDDIDVLINITDRDRVARALSAKDPNSFDLYNSAGSGSDYAYQWKFFPKEGQRLFHEIYRTPNIDIFFFFENETHIWNASPHFRYNEIWPKHHVFPLQRRPFGDLVVPAPCNVVDFLSKDFNISNCRTRAYSHIFDGSLPFPPVEVPCSRLAHLYPFVERNGTLKNKSSQFVQETLRLGYRTLGQFRARTSCFV